MTSELGFIFVAGLLGSSHCIGMCGGFAVVLGVTSTGRWRGLGRQSAYSLGRIFTYAVLGAIAGLLGHKLTTLGVASTAVRIGAGLCVLAGLFLIVEGLGAAGFSLRRSNATGESCGGCLTSPLLMNFLKAPGLHNAFLAGLMTGFLPCGLVYAFLALAAARTHPLEGMAVMTVFGLGTVPLMVLTGVGSTFLSVVSRRRLLRAAAWCVVVTGMLTVARGAGFLKSSMQQETPDCPFCATQPDVTQPTSGDAAE